MRRSARWTAVHSSSNQHRSPVPGGERFHVFDTAATESLSGQHPDEILHMTSPCLTWFSGPETGKTPENRGLTPDSRWGFFAEAGVELAVAEDVVEGYEHQ
jgi:hypothetical protein